MSNINALLNERMKKEKPISPKMTAMAKQSASGQLTTFAGLFSVSELSHDEKQSLGLLLEEYASDQTNVASDLQALASITSEVKAINNQAALLHGERIKKAQAILTKYRDGAFTAWLLSTYGNRQTPYNFLQYYELCQALPTTLRPLIEAMPRQAIYTLASREGPLEQKKAIIEGYLGQTKEQILALIRDAFPLQVGDRRRGNTGDCALHALKKVLVQLQSPRARLNKNQKKELFQVLEELKQRIDAL